MAKQLNPTYKSKQNSYWNLCANQARNAGCIVCAVQKYYLFLGLGSEFSFVNFQFSLSSYFSLGFEISFSLGSVVGLQCKNSAL